MLEKYISKKGSFVDIARALGHLTGAWKEELSSESQEICNAIGSHNHYIFILVDGMGINLMNRLPSNSFLKNAGSIKELKSVFPSTTSTALTTLVTGQYPYIHGVCGWHMYLKEKDLSITPLKYQERFSEESLEALNVDFKDIWFNEPIMKNMKYETFAVISKDFVDSHFSTYSRGYGDGAGYSNIKEAIDLTIDYVNKAKNNSFTYVYLPEYDSTCHKFGVASKEADEQLMEIDAEIKRLHEAVDGKARIIITADHGLIDVNEEDLVKIYKEDPIMEYLIAPPSSDKRFITFFVKDNMEEVFKEEFNKRFQDKILLLPFEEVDKSGLFGPEPISENVKSNFGNFVGICIENTALSYCDEAQGKVGFHAGITEDETLIPLIII